MHCTTHQHSLNFSIYRYFLFVQCNCYHIKVGTCHQCSPIVKQCSHLWLGAQVQESHCWQWCGTYHWHEAGTQCWHNDIMSARCSEERRRLLYWSDNDLDWGVRAVAVDDIISEMMGERCVNTGHISHPDNHISSMIHDHCAPADQAQVTLVPPPPAWYCDHDIYISSLPARNITLGCSLQLPTQIAAKNRQTCIIRRKIYLCIITVLIVTTNYTNVRD